MKYFLRTFVKNIILPSVSHLVPDLFALFVQHSSNFPRIILMIMLNGVSNAVDIY